MQPLARQALLDLVEGHESTPVRDAIAGHLHIKRARLHHQSSSNTEQT